MALFTAAQFKEHFGIPTAVTTHDAYLGNLATRISAAVDKYLRRTVEQASHTEIHDGTGRDMIRIRNAPINSVTSVHVSQDQTWDSTTLLATSDYSTDSGAGLVLRLPTLNPDLWPLDKPLFPKGRQNVRIIYSGGWTTVPEDIVQGALQWATAVFNRRRAAGIISRSHGGVSETFDRSPVPSAAREFLDQYRSPYRARSVS